MLVDAANCRQFSFYRRKFPNVRHLCRYSAWQKLTYFRQSRCSLSSPSMQKTQVDVCVDTQYTVLVQRTSRTSVFRWPKSLAGQTSARLNVETWLCHGPELSSVGGSASTLQHQSSGPSLSTSAQHPSVKDNRAGLKTHLFSQAYNILWEHFVLRVYFTYYRGAIDRGV